MVEIRMQGPQTGSDLGTVTVTRDDEVASLSVPSFDQPIVAPDGNPIVLIFGQSNAGHLRGANSMRHAIEGLGGSVTELLSAVGGAASTRPDGPWNIVDGDGGAQTGSAYTALIADVNAALAADPDAYIASAVWVHGEADSTPSPENYRDNYFTNTRAIFDGVRAEVGYDFPITMTLNSTMQNLTPVGTQEIQAQMGQLADTLPNAYTMDTDAVIAANGFTQAQVMRDTLHYTEFFLDWMAREVMKEPAVLARYSIPQETVLPRITGSQLMGEMATVDTTGLNNVTAIQWREVGGSDLGTDPMQMLMGAMVEVETTSDEGILVSPPITVHHAHMNASHNEMDAALMALAPHNTADNIAVASGNWSDPATWSKGIPQDQSTVLIPHGISVTYDVDREFTLIRKLRVDGVLSFATDTFTHLYVRDFIGDQMSAINIGNSLSDRIANNRHATVTFEGQSPLDLASDPQLLGRGLVTIGALNIFGKEKLNHSRAAFGVEAGATSITLEEVPVRWATGDEIIIGATSVDLPVGLGVGMQNVAQDEIVTITGVSGNTVTFSPALTYDHNNQNPRADRNDVRPMVQLRANSRNVILQSESLSPVSQRGHVMVMHMNSRTDIWDVGIIGMGRTDKSIPVGVRHTDGTFKYHDRAGITNGGIQYAPLTATSNIIGRYSFHTHLVGYDHEGAGRPMPTAVNVTIEDNPGWAFTHHDCEMNVSHSSVFRAYGCGFVSEQGGELGVWHDLSVMQATSVNNDGGDTHLVGSPKGQHGAAGLSGDTFADGGGFGYRGRALHMTRCVATTCAWGHIFWHRSNGLDPDNSLFLVSNPPRARMDLKEAGIVNGGTAELADGTWNFVHYPIVHFRECGAIACLNGVFVSKQTPQQAHDFNVIWKGFFSHGHRADGVHVEYIGTYILEDIDVVAGAQGLSDGVGQVGIRVGANTYQVALVRPRCDGNDNTGIVLSGSSLWGNVDAYDAIDEPRFFVIGADVHGSNNDIVYADAGTKTLDQVAVIQDDFDMSYIDYDLKPSETLPLVLATWSGTNTGAITSRAGNADGLKIANHSVGLPIAPKLWEDDLVVGGDLRVRAFADAFGYSQYNGNDVLIQRDLVSDVLTGRPAKITKLIQADNPVNYGITDNGPISVSSEIMAADELISVAPNGSVTFSLLNGISGGSGNYEVDDGDFVSADFGDLVIDYDTGMATYTPHSGLTDQTDYGYVFIRSVRDTGTTQTETEVMGTKCLAFIITNDATLPAPTVGTDLTLADSITANAFDVTLIQRPNTGGRHIKQTQYSTDGGTTWRRLCNGYPLTTVSVDLESDGTAISNGTYGVSFRVQTDHENGSSPATPSTNVLVA